MLKKVNELFHKPIFIFGYAAAWSIIIFVGGGILFKNYYKQQTAR